MTLTFTRQEAAALTACAQHILRDCALHEADYTPGFPAQLGNALEKLEAALTESMEAALTEQPEPSPTPAGVSTVRISGAWAARMQAVAGDLTHYGWRQVEPGVWERPVPPKEPEPPMANEHP